jgi:hypothetical protein
VLPVTLWVVSGACRQVGKTWLSQRLAAALPGAVYAKVGRHAPADGRPPNYFQDLHAWESWLASLSGIAHCVVESNELGLRGAGDARIFVGPRIGMTRIRDDAATLAERAHIVVTREGVVNRLTAPLPPGLMALFEAQRDFLRTPG